MHVVGSLSELLRCVKKKYQSAADLTAGNIAAYASVARRKPTYVEWFGFWLNRRRTFYRRAAEVAYGAAIAMCVLDPGMDYFDANADGIGEALLLKAQHDSRKRSND